VTDTALREAIARIDAITSRRGAELRFTISEAASDAALQACEEVFKNPLPPSYRRFLQRHDGVSLKIFSQADKDRPAELIEPAHELTVYGTAQAIDATREVRNFFNLAWESGIPYYNPERARSFAAWGRVYGGDHRVLFAFDRPAGAEETSIVDVSLDASDWVAERTQWEPSFAASMASKGYRVVATEPVASSVEEFLERGLAFMLAHERGFGYWYGVPDADELW
jgi:hypothetical protein